MDTEHIKKRFESIAPFLDERLRRIFAAAEAMAIGYGGPSIVSRETGVSRAAIALGLNELKEPEKADTQRIRKKAAAENEPQTKTLPSKKILRAYWSRSHEVTQSRHSSGPARVFANFRTN